LVEHVIRNDGVTGSSPVCGTSFSNMKQVASVAVQSNRVCVIFLTYPLIQST
jgi:hypothetical protein